METLPNLPCTKGAAQMFTGDVYADVIYTGKEPSRLCANTVRFEPGARAAWHSHALDQVLYVTEGTGLVQSRDGGMVIIRPGDVVYTPRTNSTGTVPCPTAS
ncbi:cupin domain-containing protein [Rhodococcus koreensis]|uniref:cupin domain-containing protein n=1 Tax=Rhodococcus koreensis TaxID=99653 RepID=UPI003671ED25